VEKLKQFAFDVCNVGRDESHSMHTTHQEAVYQQCNQPGHQAMSIASSIDVCSVSGPPRFVTLIACISIQHAPGMQCKMESNWMPSRYTERGGERRGKQTLGGRRLNWRPAENKEIITQCTRVLHFQGKPSASNYSCLDSNIEGKFKLEIRSSQIRTSFNNPNTVPLYALQIILTTLMKQAYLLPFGLWLRLEFPNIKKHVISKHVIGNF